MTTAREYLYSIITTCAELQTLTDDQLATIERELKNVDLSIVDLPDLAKE